MTLRIQMISDDVHALQRELRNHAELGATVLANANTFEDCIAMIADHCDVVLHGEYSEEDVNKLCRLLVGKLQDKRCVIINSVADPRMNI
ncbi:hypothetical protein D3C81_1185920 [compost metagenome]